MTDDALDPQVVRELRDYVDGATRPIDAMAIAASASAAGTRRRVPRTTLVLLAAALILALAAAVAVGVGTRPSIVQPTGHTVAGADPGSGPPRAAWLTAARAARPTAVSLVAGGDVGYCLDAACSSATTTTTAEVFDPAHWQDCARWRHGVG